jgi:hypothetical protein
MRDLPARGTRLPDPTISRHDQSCPSHLRAELRKIRPGCFGNGLRVGSTSVQVADQVNAAADHNRRQAARARHDMRSWQVERRKRTRHLIELGGLVVKAGIVD